MSLPHDTPSRLGPWYLRAICWFLSCDWRVHARPRAWRADTWRAVNTAPPMSLSECRRCGTIVNELPLGARYRARAN